MAKKGFKGLNMLVLGGGGLLLVVLFFLGAYKVKEGFTSSNYSWVVSDDGKTHTDMLTIVATASTEKLALDDLRRQCSMTNRIGKVEGQYVFTSSNVSEITVSKNRDIYKATGKCSRIFTKST